MRVEVIGCLSIADRPLIIKKPITPGPPTRRCSERRFSREALYYMCKTLLKNTYAAIVALFIAMMALPTTAQAQKSKMSMRLCGKYYSADATIPLGGGTAKWNQATTTLTLNNVKVENLNASFLWCNNIPNLKIVLVGKNTVSTTWYTLYWGNGNVEISGTGSLTARSGDNTAITNDDKPSTLTIKDCTLDVRGNDYSIIGFHNRPGTESLTLVVDNATVKVKGSTGGWGWKFSGIGYLKAYELRNCYISTPGVKFGKKDTYYELVGTDGDTYYGEVTIKPATTFDLRIAGTQVSTNNCADLSTIPGVSGKASYDPGTKTLTLQNAKLNAESGNCIRSKIDGLTIKVSGTNELNAESAIAIFIEAPATITGGGTLNAKSQSNRAVLVDRADLTIDNCTVNAKGKWGITGSFGLKENLSINNATVTAEGWAGSICDFNEITLEGCAITRPVGAVADESRGAVVLDRKTVTSEVKIEPVTYYDLEICGTWVHSANCGDLSYIKGVSGTVKYDPDNNILTLENTTINAGGGFAILSESDDLTIKVIGTNNITSENYSAVNLYSSATITGGGTLRVDCTDETSIYAISTDRLLTIKDCTVNAKGRRNGIKGNNSPLVIKNATVTAEGREEGSICDFKEIALEGCAITRPAGATFDESKHAIVLNGEIVKSEVKIEPITKYDLWINGTRVTSDNCSDLSGISGVSGWVEYDPDNKILTLEDAKLNVEGDNFCIWSEIDGLTIKVSGTNELNAGNITILVYAPMTITGGGTLNAESRKNSAIWAKETNLTIKNCIVNVKGRWGIAGYGGPTNNLLISNATVRAEGRDGSICDFKEITLEDCAITQPAGATFDESKHAIVLNGETVTSEVKIVQTKYDLWIAGTQVTLDNCGDLSVIDGVEGTVKYDPNTKTLTLKDATIYTAEKRGIRNNVDGQTILLFGENTITSKKFDGVSNGDVTLTITGSGKLTVNGAMTGVDDGFCLAIDNSEDGTVIIDGCTLEASAGCYGFSEGCWKFINCTVRVKGGGSRHDEYAGSICNLLEKPTFIGCAVISPAKAYWGDHANISDETRYDLYGEDKKVVTDWVTIADPTGINTPTIDTAAKQGIYTLSGVKLDGEVKDLPKGVYIVNGKKFVKK